MTNELVGSAGQIEWATLFQQVVTLSEMISRQARHPPGETLYDFGPVKVRTEFCNGRVLVCTFMYDASVSVEFPAHTHIPGVVEIATLNGPGHVTYRFKDGFSKTLRNPGDVVHVPPEMPHVVQFVASGGPAQGTMLLIPPDPALIPLDALGHCELRPFGACGRSDVCSIPEKGT